MIEEDDGERGHSKDEPTAAINYAAFSKTIAFSPSLPMALTFMCIFLPIISSIFSPSHVATLGHYRGYIIPVLW